MSTVASYINLSSFSPQVFDQLDLNSCVENAICQAIALQGNMAGQHIAPLARQALYYDTRVIENTLQYGDYGTLLVSHAISAAMTGGITSEAIASAAGEAYAAEASGNWAKAPTDAMIKDAKQHLLTGSTSFDNGSSLTDNYLRAEIGEQLMHGKAVIMTATIPVWLSSLHYNDVTTAPPLKLPTAQAYAANSYSALAALHDKGMNTALPTADVASNVQNSGSHAFIIVGMDNSLFSGRGGYIIENSWGTSFGVQGYDVIPYSFRSEGFAVKEMAVLNGFNGMDQTWTAGRTQASELFASVLNRAGEYSGVKFWGDALQSGTTATQVIDGLLNSAEGKALYSVSGIPMNDTQFVTQTYLNVRGHVATQSNMDVALYSLQHDTTRAQFMETLIRATDTVSAGATMAEHDRLVNRTTAAEDYAITYHGQGHLDVAASVLQNITSDANSVQAALIGLPHALGYV